MTRTKRGPTPAMCKALALPGAVADKRIRHQKR